MPHLTSHLEVICSSTSDMSLYIPGWTVYNFMTMTDSRSCFFINVLVERKTVAIHLVETMSNSQRKPTKLNEGNRLRANFLYLSSRIVQLNSLQSTRRISRGDFFLSIYQHAYVIIRQFEPEKYTIYPPCPVSLLPV